ncbi:hypothetical protein NKH77_44870 [Streptomyces sp. M19]
MRRDSVFVRSASASIRDGKPTGLGDGFARYGRIFKTRTCSSSSPTRDTGG